MSPASAARLAGKIAIYFAVTIASSFPAALLHWPWPTFGAQLSGGMNMLTMVLLWPGLCGLRRGP